MKELLKKASTYTFDNGAEGECFLMTMCLTKYMLEEEGITLQSHIGGIKRGKMYVTHLWNSYEGKRIDLTSHRQPKLVVNGSILGEPIEIEENAKIVDIKKMDNKIVRSYSKLYFDSTRKRDKNSITVSHILLDNLNNNKDGLVSYEILQKALNYRITYQPFLYKNFYDYMKN